MNLNPISVLQLNLDYFMDASDLLKHYLKHIMFKMMN